MTENTNPLLLLAKQRLGKAGLPPESESTTFGREGHDLLARDAVFCKRLLQSTNLAHVYGLLGAGFNPYFCVAAKNRKDRLNAPLGFTASLLSTPGHAEYQAHFNFYGLGGCGAEISAEMVSASFIHGIYDDDLSYFRSLHGSGLYSVANFNACAEAQGGSNFIQLIKSCLSSEWVEQRASQVRLRGDLVASVLLRLHDPDYAIELVQRALDIYSRDAILSEASSLLSVLLHASEEDSQIKEPGLWLYEALSLNQGELEQVLPAILSKLTEGNEYNEELYCEFLLRTSSRFRDEHRVLIIESSAGFKSDKGQVLHLMRIPEMNEALGNEAVKVFGVINTPGKLAHAYTQNPHFVSAFLALAEPIFKERYGLGEKLVVALQSMPDLRLVPASLLGKDEVLKVMQGFWAFHQAQYPYDPDRYAYPWQSVTFLKKIGALVHDDKTATFANTMLEELVATEAKEALLSEAPSEWMMKHVHDNHIKKILISRDLEI